MSTFTSIPSLVAQLLGAVMGGAAVTLLAAVAVVVVAGWALGWVRSL